MDDPRINRAFERATSADDFACRSGIADLLFASHFTADDLGDVIEILRARGEYHESDRLRKLRARLRDAYAPLNSLGLNIPPGIMAAYAREAR